MKIVHIHQYYNDGMGYQENILPKYQAKLGHEVIVITSNLGFDFQTGNRVYKVKVYKENNVTIKRISIKREFKNRFVIFKNLMEELVKLKPDYIYHHSVTAPSVKTVCEYKQKNPEVFLVTDNHADLTISGRNKLWKIVYYNVFWKKILRKYCKNVDLHFGVTPSRCLFLEEELGVDKNKIKLLPIGADTDSLQELDEDILEKYSINKENLKIVHGGKITKLKEGDKLIKAFQRIEEKNINLVLFGKIEEDEIKELIKKDSRIIYLGWLNRRDTLSILNRCDLGIWNTQHTTLLEDAIATKLPLILRYYGSTSHLIDNSGMYLYEGNEREIYEKLKFVIENKLILQEFKSNASKMKEYISYSNIAKESIEYKDNIMEETLHQKFMVEKYSDINYKYFRQIKIEK